MNAFNGHPGSASDRETLRQLDGEIAKGRDELGVLVAELDRRRHRLFDVKAQLKQHLVVLSVTGIAFTAITAAAVWLAIQRARRRQTFISRASRFRTAVNRMIANPEAVATEPTMSRQLFTAVAAAALGGVTRAIVAKGIESAMEAARHEASRSTQPREAARRPYGATEESLAATTTTGAYDATQKRQRTSTAFDQRRLQTVERGTSPGRSRSIGS